MILITGTVKGNIKATSRVEIRKPARFEGTITSPSLIVILFLSYGEKYSVIFCDMDIFRYNCVFFLYQIFL